MTSAALPVTSPRATGGLFSPEYRSVTIGMVALVALGAFESLGVSTAMPTVADELGGISLYAMAFAGPLAASVVGLTLAGHWADRRGPVMPLLTGVALFVAGLLIAGTAGTMPVLVAGRVLQGVGSGLYSVVLYVIVARVYPALIQPRVFSAFSAAWVVPGIVGPSIAGLVVETVGWRWVFLSVPVLAVPAVAALRPALAGLRARPQDAQEPPAVAGTARRAIALAALTALGVLVLHHGGQERGGSMAVWVAAGLVMVGLALPRLLPVGTLRGRRGLPTVIGLRGLISAAFFGAEVYLPLLLKTHHGLSPAQAGAVLTFGAVTWAVGAWARGHNVLPWSDVGWLRCGAVLIGVGVSLSALLVLDPVPVVVGFAGWVVAGVGMGMAFPTLSLLTLRLSAPHEQGVNSSALQLMDAAGVSLTLALTGTLFTVLDGPQSSGAFVVAFAISIAFVLVGITIVTRTVPVGPAGSPARDDTHP